MGGGSPTFLSDDELEQLLGILQNAFRFVPGGEYAIEIDPRTIDAGRLKRLAAIGFNRLSFGVQDFDPAVQQAVHRVQSVEGTKAVIDWARKHGFNSVSVDLIYGLPKQTPETFKDTVNAVIAMDPDRLSVYSYAHLPTIFKPQRRIAEEDLPVANPLS